MNLVRQVRESLRRTLIWMRRGPALVEQLAALQAEHNRWAEAEPLIESFLALPEVERTKILSIDSGQYVVGTRNAATRDAWVAEVLAENAAAGNFVGVAEREPPRVDPDHDRRPHRGGRRPVVFEESHDRAFEVGRVLLAHDIHGRLIDDDLDEARLGAQERYERLG